MTESKKFNWSMVAVALALALVVQAASLVFWGGGLSSRVAALGARTAPLADGALARLDERTLSIKEAQSRMEQKEGGGGD
ncbi:hypothetical protein JIX58_00775 [Brevundimonas diminuta]|uniref:hypothetical protein n=1 Tax=Brevundimonas TaxID=41275 RepID=UPI001905E6B7|nr:MULTISPECIES: hypothetical protein [Brevundimonas]MBK1974276.1 hypothetical protein [Brevundimonas diminuta]MDA0742804.1 hypothetical protein [Pseudomonadota bacterium]MDA1322545.1 hypothetical protein [Pseudomonadota bacterium]